MLQAGQFVNIKINGEASTIRRQSQFVRLIKLNQFKMIYRAEGEGTKLLSQKQAGEQVDILGPLGTGFDIEDVQANETVVLVGGGVGSTNVRNGKRYMQKLTSDRCFRILLQLMFSMKKNLKLMRRIHHDNGW